MLLLLMVYGCFVVKMAITILFSLSIPGAYMSRFFVVFFEFFSQQFWFVFVFHSSLNMHIRIHIIKFRFMMFVLSFLFLNTPWLFFVFVLSFKHFEVICLLLCMIFRNFTQTYTQSFCVFVYSYVCVCVNVYQRPKCWSPEI